LQPSAKACKLKKDSHGKGDRVLRAVDFQETLEMVLATATRKDYRVLHASKEIRLNSDVHGSHITWGSVFTIGTRAWREGLDAFVRYGAVSLPQEANGVTVRPSTVASIA
jgi:hypothetical protein